MTVDLGGAPLVPRLRGAREVGALEELEGAELEGEHAPRARPRPRLGVAVVGDDLAVLRAVAKLVGDVVPALVGLGGAPVLVVVRLRAGRDVLHPVVVEGEDARQPLGGEVLPVGHALVAQLPRLVDGAVEHLVGQRERLLALPLGLLEDVARQALHELDRGQLDHHVLIHIHRLPPGPVILVHRLSRYPVESEVAVAVDGGAFQQAGAQSLELLLTDAPAVNLQLGERSVSQAESHLVVYLQNPDNVSSCLVHKSTV